MWHKHVSFEYTGGGRTGGGAVAMNPPSSCHSIASVVPDRDIGVDLGQRSKAQQGDVQRRQVFQRRLDATSPRVTHSTITPPQNL